MPERSASGRVTAELEAELARLDRDQLMRLCAHLIRTYVIEPGRSGESGATATAQRSTSVAAPAPPPQQTTSAPPPQAAGPAPAETPPPPPRPSRTARTEPEPPPPSTDGRFNKLEMD